MVAWERRKAATTGPDKEDHENTKAENANEKNANFFSTFRVSCFRVPLLLDKTVKNQP